MDRLSILFLKTSHQMSKQGESNNLIFMQILSLQEDYMSANRDYRLMFICIS